MTTQPTGPVPRPADSPAEPDPRPHAVEEFERQPVPDRALKGFWSFVSLFAGEHVAGTEFMIGPLFLAAGVSAFDLLAGLLLGNLLATASWTFVCAPVAVRTRLTLYAQLERVCGPRLTTLYNLANGLLFCILAGAMISVSATAVGVPFNVKMPGLQDWLPNSAAWIVCVALIGAAFAVIAAKGYDAMARLAALAVPWMTLVFLACGLIALPQLGVHSPSQFWSVATERIWTGGAPFPGQVKFTFWHVVFFAWTCNAATHIGLVDMTIFRYARKWQYGAASGAGMAVGHYMAWVCASLLYALQLAHDPADTKVAPGPMAWNAAGSAGLICVILAGWTTANPTLYRAGLAFQGILPRSSRFNLTLLAGALATLGAIFPALVMKLLDFVGLYGTLLMPMGAVIFVDFWILPRLGLQPERARARCLPVNWAAALAWAGSLLACALLNQFAGWQIYFLAIPGWFVAAGLYLGLSRAFQPAPAARS